MTTDELNCLRAARDLADQRDLDTADQLVERGWLSRTEGPRHLRYHLTTQGANALRDLGTSTPGPSGLGSMLGGAS